MGMHPESISQTMLLEIIRIQTEVVQQGPDLGALMNLVSARAQGLTGADGACIELIEDRELVYRAATGLTEKFLGIRLPEENSLSGECIRMAKPLICMDTETDERVNREACRRIGFSSMIVLPLISGAHVVGVLKVLSARAGHFSDADICVLELISGLVAAAMQHAMVSEGNALLYQATHDSMTGLANRALFYDKLRQRLAQAMTRHEDFGILSVDMDGLKEINDTRGHRAGDAAICEVARRIAGVMDPADLAARLGGDEFGVLITSAKGRESLIRTVELLGDAVNRPFSFEGAEFVLGASMGFAHFREDGIELDTLIEKADQAMYQEKRARKGPGNVR